MIPRPDFIVVIIGSVFTATSTIVVALRYYCRYGLMKSAGVSDHLLLAALLLTWGNFVLNYYQEVFGGKIKKKFFKIPSKQEEMRLHVQGTLITWWVYRITYLIALCIIKLSILFLYRSMATAKTFRRLVYATVAIVCLYTFGACIASAFACDNPSDAWNPNNMFAKNDGNPNTKKQKLRCYKPARFWVFCAAFNLLTSFMILLLPVSTLLSLRIPMRKRIALIGIFSVGIMAIIASSVRMWFMMLWAEKANQNVKYSTDVLLWGQLETNCGIIAAALPFLGLLFQRKNKGKQDIKQKNADIGLIDNAQEASGHIQSFEMDTWAYFGMKKDYTDPGPYAGPSNREGRAGGLQNDDISIVKARISAPMPVHVAA